MIARENIPHELARERRWVTWRLVVRNGKRTKPPDQATNDARAWLTLARAIKYAERTGADGIGFVLGTGLVGVDIDHCISDEGELSNVARDALESIDTYAERSPSGRGIHLILRASFPNHSYNDRELGLEIYDGSDGHARFFTITGHRFTNATEIADGVDTQGAFDALRARWIRVGAPLREIVDEPNDAAQRLNDGVILSLLFAAKNAQKAQRLFEHGDWSGYPSQSEADLALVRMLRFYTREVAQLDRLFRRSALMRAKWDKRHGAQTYGATTIAEAIAMGGHAYQPRRNRRLVAASSFTVREEWFAPLRRMGEVPAHLVLAIAKRADAHGVAKVRRSELAAELGITERNVTKSVGAIKGAGVVTFQVDCEGYVFHLQGASSDDASSVNERGDRDAA